jgi:hypothetical protein
VNPSRPRGDNPGGGYWTRRKVNTALALLTVLAVGCGVGAIALLAIALGIDVVAR